MSVRIVFFVLYKFLQTRLLRQSKSSRTSFWGEEVDDVAGKCLDSMTDTQGTLMGKDKSVHDPIVQVRRPKPF